MKKTDRARLLRIYLEDAARRQNNCKDNKHKKELEKDTFEKLAELKRLKEGE